MREEVHVLEKVMQRVPEFYSDRFNKLTEMCKIFFEELAVAKYSYDVC